MMVEWLEMFWGGAICVALRNNNWKSVAALVLEPQGCSAIVLRVLD